MMMPLRLADHALDSRAGRWGFDLANHLLYVDAVRKPLVSLLDRWLGSLGTAAPSSETNWQTIVHQRKLIFRAALRSVDRIIEKGALSPQVARVIIALWSRALFRSLTDSAAAERFRQENGVNPPWFLVLSPSHACNLSCPGCYATSGRRRDSRSAATLPWPVLDRVMTEAKELWGVPLFTLSGGEPLTYRSEGRDLLDAVEKHNDCLFLMFTNGTLINRETAGRLARLGNLTPALSVEGLRGPTDERRGSGTFDRVLEAMARLREAGVPFGISITVTRANCESVLSDALIDFFFHEQGAFYAFLFPYMPTGGEPDFNWMLTPEQRVAFWRRSWEIVRDQRIFLLDFGNHGPLVEGCISAGRERGYLHIDWNGKVMPCVFMPYVGANVREIYAAGGTLNDVWSAPFFQAIRHWQREYGYGRGALSKEGNWMRPCPMRDHYGTLREWVADIGAEPEDEAARHALANAGFCEQMTRLGREHAPCCQEIWEAEYLLPRADTGSRS
jgi:MoaA/NifB/PqqE/SkfB family radical SAM enzyme